MFVAGHRCYAAGGVLHVAPFSWERLSSYEVDGGGVRVEPKVVVLVCRIETDAFHERVLAHVHPLLLRRYRLVVLPDDGQELFDVVGGDGVDGRGSLDRTWVRG